MMQWFLKLDQAAQAALASGVVSSVVIGVIAVLGFWITFNTSTAAMQKSLQLSSKMKVAEFRMKWIDEFRIDLAQLMKIRVETITLQKREAALKKKGKYLAQDAVQKKRDLDVESMMLRGRLLLRLKPDSGDAEEAELERILKSAMERDPDKATIQRKRILVLSRILLKKEWEKVKTELGQTT